MTSHSNDIRQAWRALSRQIEPTSIMTLGVGLGASAITFESHARRLFNVLQRKARGRNWHKYDPSSRPWAVGFIEEGANRMHMHLAVHLPKETNLRGVFGSGKDEWERIRRGGDYFYAPLDDPVAYISYITKRLHRPITANNVFIYTPRAHVGF